MPLLAEKTGVLALSLLSVLFSPKTKSSAGGDIPHFLKCVPVSDRNHNPIKCISESRPNVHSWHCKCLPNEC